MKQDGEAFVGHNIVQIPKILPSLKGQPQEYFVKWRRKRPLFLNENVFSQI